MTTTSHGWAFLVGRGRHTVYRTVLAPAFLVTENLQHLLADSAGDGGSDRGRARVVEVGDARVGPFSIAYRGEQPALADLETDGAGGAEMLADEHGRPLDEHGRPLEIVYGIVSRDGLQAPVAEADLQIARAQALASYRRFLADERHHAVEVAEGFALRTRGHARAGRRSTPVVDATDPRPPTASPTRVAPERGALGMGRPPRHRRTMGAVAGAVALVVAGVVLAASAGDEQVAGVSPAWLDSAPTGPVRLCAIADATATRQRSLRDFNVRFPSTRATLHELASSADDQEPAYLRPIDRRCDVVSVDVIDVAALAARRLLLDMTPYVKTRQGEFDSQMLETVRFGGRSWGVPARRDVGALYYRADRVHRPTSWRDVIRQSARGASAAPPGLRLPVGTPEDRAVVLLELAYTAGAQPIVSADGRRARIDQPAMLEALELLRDARRDGAIPASAQSDRGALTTYELGRASFLRGWPFVAAHLRGDAAGGSTTAAQRARRAAAAHTRVMPLPPWKPGGASVGVLGGSDLVILRSAPNRRAALRLVDFLTSPAQVRREALDGSGLPVLTAVATDGGVSSQPLMRAIGATKVVTRPQIPAYAMVSTILARGVAAVLHDFGQEGLARSTLSAMQRQVQAVLDDQHP